MKEQVLLKLSTPNHEFYDHKKHIKDKAKKFDVDWHDFCQNKDIFHNHMFD